MKNFTSFINNMVENHRRKGVKELLQKACGPATLGHLPTTIGMTVLKQIQKENEKFSYDVLEEVHHYLGRDRDGEPVYSTYWVDKNGFYHHDPEEARAYLVMRPVLEKARDKEIKKELTKLYGGIRYED